MKLVTKPHAAMKRLNECYSWGNKRRPHRYKTARGYEALKPLSITNSDMLGNCYKTARGYEALKLKLLRKNEVYARYKTARGYEALKRLKNTKMASGTIVTKPHAAMKRLNSVP